jgi:hypothetical protein
MNVADGNAPTLCILLNCIDLLISLVKVDTKTDYKGINSSNELSKGLQHSRYKQDLPI